MDDTNDDEQFLAQQKSWLRPFLTQAYSLASRSDSDNWKRMLYNNFQKCLGPTSLSGAQIAAGMTGSRCHPHIRLRWSARQSTDPLVRMMDVSAKMLPDLISPAADVDVFVSQCCNFICRFLNAYDIGERNSKLSPFDQASWDKMIWQYWTVIQFTNAKNRPLDGGRVPATSPNGLPPVPVFLSNDSILTSTTTNDPIGDSRVVPSRNPNAAKNMIVRYFNPVLLPQSYGAEQSKTKKENDKFNKIYSPRFTYKVCVGSAGFPDFYTCIRGKQTGACLERAEHRMVEINTQTFKLKERARMLQASTNNNLPEERPVYTCDQVLDVRHPEIHPQDAVTKVPAFYPETGRMNAAEEKTHKVNKKHESASPEAEHSEGHQEDADPELEDDLGSETSDPTTFPWNISKTAVPVAKIGLVAKTKKSIAAQQGKSSQKGHVKRTPVPSPETPTDAPLVQLAVRKEPLYRREQLEDIQSGFSMLHFLSVAFLRAASWISDLEIHRVTAMIFHNKRFCFTSGRWTAEDPEAVKPDRPPRVLITCVHEIYDTAGSPLLRGIFLMPPEHVSFKDWYTVTTQLALYRAIEAVPLAESGLGSHETLTAWLENGVFRPRVESVGVVLEAILGVLNSYRVDFRIGLHFLAKTRGIEPNGDNDPEFTFWDSLLKSFPNIELLVNPPFSTGQYQDWKNAVNTRKIFSSWDVNEPELGYHMEIGPRTLITQIATQSAKAKHNAQEIIFSAVTGLQWDVAADFLYYQIAAGFQAFAYVVSGFHTPCQRAALEKIKELN